MSIGGFQPQSFAELFPGGFAVAGFEQGIGEILVNIGAQRRERRSVAKALDGAVVIPCAKGVESFCQRSVGGVFNGVLSGTGRLPQRCRREQNKNEQ